MDGGVRSSDNADLVTGSAEIVVVSPLGLDPPFPSPLPLRDVVGRLRAEGSAVTVISPDAASGAALGVNPLDPATGSPPLRPAARRDGPACRRAVRPNPKLP